VYENGCRLNLMVWECVCVCGGGISRILCCYKCLKVKAGILGRLHTLKLIPTSSVLEFIVHKQ